MSLFKEIKNMINLKNLQYTKICPKNEKYHDGEK